MHSRLLFYSVKYRVPRGIIGDLPQIKAMVRQKLVDVLRQLQHIIRTMIDRYRKLRLKARYRLFRARQCLALSALDIILYQCTADTAARRIERIGGAKRAVVAAHRLSARTLAEPLLPTGAPCTGVYHSDIIVLHQPPHTLSKIALVRLESVNALVLSANALDILFSRVAGVSSEGCVYLVIAKSNNICRLVAAENVIQK